MEQLKRAKWAYIILSILMTVLGVCILIWPGTSVLLLCYLVGIICIMFGVIKFIGYFSKDQYDLAFQFDFALGIFALVIGVLLLFHPSRIVALMQFIIGLFILIDGVFKLQTAIDAKRFGLARWWTILMLALCCAAGGLLLMLNPFGSALALMFLMGLSLIVDGTQNLVVVLYTVRCLRNSPAADKVVFEE